jgi:N-acetylglucosaminyldiphosphoundecaprenol N-acetyl-beta-D-mannosaminyltransferase
MAAPSNPPNPPPVLPARAAVLGVPLAISDYSEVLDWVDAMVAAKSLGSLTAAAVHLVMLAREDPATREAVLATTLVVPDGQPLVWALRLLGHREISTRVYGPELMLRCCERAAARGTRMYLYGGRNEGALVALTLNLRTRFPGLQIVGASAPPHVAGNSWAPFRELSEEESRALVEEIDGTGAEIVWVGTGQPRQELWMARMRPYLSAPMLIGVGAAFDFHAGLVSQAPGWIGSHGLEWLFRLAREPRRLWRRYLRYNPRFVVAFARQYAEQRFGRRGRAQDAKAGNR